ncbi:MAG: FAD-binding oxidoreductase [Alphaproteobacteria bacterium]|nr:FAD-binding oxidoreductase [Alphaproteobacteria bacterium]
MYTPVHDSEEPAQTPFLRTAGAALNLPALAGSHGVDIAIVGGGISGCSAALHAAERGARVIVIEARTVGWGASSRNAGHLPASTKYEPQELIDTYGPVFGERILNASETGPLVMDELIKRHGIACEFSIPGIINAAHTPETLKKLEQRARFWQERGRPVEALSRERLAELLGSNVYLGGVLDRRGGAVNPLAYVRGLARAAIKAGAQIHEGTRATALAREGSRWRLSVAGGEVRADFVLLCTNAHTDTLWPSLRQSIIPVRTVQFTTKPLSENLRRSILPERQLLLDTRRTPISLRMYPDGRLHFGGGPFMRAGLVPDWRAMLGRVNEVLPQLGEVEMEEAWAGWMAFNRYDAWQMHSLAPGLLAVLGCNGRGVTQATIYGRDLALHATGVPASELTLPMSQPKRYPMHPFSGFGAAMIVKWYRMKDAAEMRKLHTEHAPRA